MNRLDLSQDIDAVAVLLDHPGQAADLALDPGQPLEHWSFDALYPGSRVSLPSHTPPGVLMSVHGR